MRVGPSTPTEPRCSPPTTTGATTTEQADSGSTPCSIPIATDIPRSTMSRTRDTTMNCCSSVCRTSRTTSTASNAPAIHDAPPTYTWSSPETCRIASNALAHTASTAASPLGPISTDAMRRTDQRACEMGRRGVDRRVGRLRRQVDDLVLDRPVAEDDHDRRVLVRQPRRVGCCGPWRPRSWDRRPPPRSW